MKYIEQRSSVINPLTDFKKLKESKKSLRIKLGVDPTAPDVTLGWYAVIRALKKFQEYGYSDNIIPYYWMPKYVNAKDASARTLNVYNEVQNQ